MLDVHGCMTSVVKQKTGNCLKGLVTVSIDERGHGVLGGSQKWPHFVAYRLHFGGKGNMA